MKNSPQMKPKASIVVLSGLVCLVAACNGEVTSRQEVADYVGEAVAAEMRGPVQDLAQRGSGATDPFEGLVDEVLDGLEMPSGVLRLMEGSGIGWHVEDGAAWASTSVVVVPDDDPSDPYCLAIGVHSDGRMITQASPADPRDGCAGAREADFN